MIAKFCKFNPAKLRIQGIYRPVADLKSDWQAFLWVGLPAMIFYLIFVVEMVRDPRPTTYLLFDMVTYIHLPFRRIVGFVAAVKIARLKGTPVKGTPWYHAARYFQDLFRPTNKNYTVPTPMWVVVLAPLVGYVVFWPLALIAGTYHHMTLLTTQRYSWPDWRVYKNLNATEA